MKTNIFITVLLLAALLSSCNDDKAGPMDHNQNPPGQVTITDIENLPGKVQLTYTLPTDQDLLYVKAVYKLNSGAMREIKASYYTNTMLLDGFGDNRIYEVDVFAVNRSEVASAPVRIEVEPLENPIWGVRRSLEVVSDFSGFSVKAENPAKEPVSIEIMILDSLDTWQNMEGIESRMALISGAKRGLDTLTYDVRFTVRDRFLNYTDTLYSTVNPLFEMKLDKAKWKSYNLPGDAKAEQPGWLEMNRMWDGIYSYTNHERWLTANDATGNPQISTFDIGVTAQLSRMTLFNWGNDGGSTGQDRLFYYGEHMRYFEIWGSNNPATDGSLEPSWVRLASFENLKPSQLPYGQQSKEDYEAAVKGFDFIFPLENPVKVKYIRIRNIASWNGSTKFGIAEIDLYGDPR